MTILDVAARERARAAFRELATTTQAEVEARLASVLEARRARLAAIAPEAARPLDAAADLVLRGGKRFRAVLVRAAYEGLAAEGAPREPAIVGGAAYELVQAYLLVQDDWMDGDVTRRGGRTAHERLADELGSAHLGACSAVLASDLLFGYALELLTSDALGARERLTALRTLLETHEAVVAGQHLDVTHRAPSVELLHALKTGSYTVRGPLRLGFALAGAEPSSLDGALEAFAEPVGLAFQLRDDLLGTFGSEARTGKPVGNDLALGKRTAVLRAAEERVPAHELARALEHAREGQAAQAALTLRQHGVLEVVARRIDELIVAGARAALSLPLRDASRQALAGAALELAWEDA